MLEPRRLAARAAAERMAETLGEAVGATVGYRIRGEAKVRRATRIEVVTEGILTRMIQSDPGLDGIGALIFDEFHERSLNADLGLALALEVRGALRPDLRAAGDVGDAGRRAGGRADGRCAGGHLGRARLSGRDPLAGPRPAAERRGSRRRWPI